MKQFNTIWRYKRWSILAGFMAILLTFWLSQTDFVERWELRSQEARLLLRGPRSTRAKIVIVEVTDSTLRTWPEPQVFWGTRFARLLHQARHAKAAWVGLDFIPVVSADDYLETTPSHRPDRDFAQALRESGGNVILSSMLNVNGEPINPNPQFSTLPETENRIGFVDIPPTLDDVARFSALYVDADTIRPSFSALLGASATGIDAENAFALKTMAGAIVRQSHGATFQINYTLRPFPRIPAEKLARGELSRQEHEELRDAILLIGAAYRGSGDKHVVPGGKYADGVEINANAISTLIDHRGVKRWAGPQEALATVCLAALTLLMVASLRFTWGLTLILTTIMAWSFLTLRVFAASDLFLPIVGPLSGMALPFTVFHLARSVEEGRRRLLVERTFGRYVSPQIRNHLLQSPENARLGGAVCMATVVFLDVRGVTTYSEGRDPSQVMSELNLLFGEIVPIIDRHGGLLYAYTGDGFLAVFGAPYPMVDHAQAAVEAALEIVRHVRGWNQTSGERAWRVGCGIHSGQVACGSLGIAERSEYTVIGDTVNLTARLESLNKEFGSEIVLSQETVTLLRVHPVLCGPVSQEIRGRKQQAVVYYIQVSE